MRPWRLHALNLKCFESSDVEILFSSVSHNSSFMTIPAVCAVKSAMVAVYLLSKAILFFLHPLKLLTIIFIHSCLAKVALYLGYHKPTILSSPTLFFYELITLSFSLLPVYHQCNVPVSDLIINGEKIISICEKQTHVAMTFLLLIELFSCY